MNELPSLRLSGEVDLSTSRELAESLNELVGSTTHVAAVDVSAVTFMDTTGLGALVKTAERLRRQSRSLILVCPPGPVRTLLETTGMLDRFLVTDGDPDPALMPAA
jgi:anti-sigma B factor antagonist